MRVVHGRREDRSAGASHDKGAPRSESDEIPLFKLQLWMRSQFSRSQRDLPEIELGPLYNQPRGANRR